ncbi:MAG: carbohydrate kinase family protein [Anaerolineales bacterium]|nr:carbohydrate kinase family protein [Anaerolineales bacterium]
MSRNNPAPRDVFVGEFQREFSLVSDERWLLDMPGGNALYASVGYLVWEKEQSPGILTRVGENFPQSWLEDFSKNKINIEGVVFLPQAVDLRACYVHQGTETNLVDNPIPYFSRLGMTLPPALIDYTSPRTNPTDRRTKKDTSIRERDIPQSYLTATGAHLCPLDYLSHNLLPAVLRQQGFSTITLDPASSYMEPAYFGDIPALITGLTAFMPSEEDLKNLYKGKTTDLWEMAADLCRFGCEMVVIKRGVNGQYLYDGNSSKRWDITPYPARVQNPIGAGDAFCGGFLAGYRRTFDPLQATLYGNVASSLVIEGSGPFFALNALPGLAKARLEYIQGVVREV